MEARLKTSIFYVGGLDDYGLLPEASPINYVARVRIPILMLNGKYDMEFPYETKAKPMFDLLGTPKDQKVQKLYNTDHYIPRNELIKETLAWLALGADVRGPLATRSIRCRPHAGGEL